MVKDKAQPLITSRFRVFEEYWISLFYSESPTLHAYPAITGHGAILRSYAPDQTSLYKDTVRLNTVNQEDMLNFCKKYGILCNPSNRITKAENLTYENLQIIPPIEHIRLDDLRTAIQEIQTTLKAWKDCNRKNAAQQEYSRLLQENDLSPDWRQSPELPSGIDPDILDDLESEYRKSPEYRALDNVRYDSDMVQARQFIVSQITKNLQPYTMVQGITFDKGRFRPFVAFQRPIDYCWYRLKDDIVAGVSYGECLKCGSLFPKTKKGQLFCPPDATQQRSQCENYLSGRFRDKKHIILEMLKNPVNDIDYIAAYVGIPVEYIEHRLNRKKPPSKEGSQL